MPINSQLRTSRYSRPPSLSTIGSNEEADFSASRRTRNTFQTVSSISPSEEYVPAHHNQILTAPHAPGVSRIADRSVSSHEASHHTDRDRYIRQQPPYNAAALHNYSHRPIAEPEQPHLANNQPLTFVLPAMDARSESDASEISVTKTKFMKTRYMWMLLQLDQIPWWHNFLAAVAAWIVLAAYLIVPGTFTSIKKTTAMDTSSGQDPAKAQLDNIAGQIVHQVDNLGLLVFSGILAGAGGLVCTFLFFMHWQNYAWLSLKIFQPMTLNAFAGLLTTIVNVYTAQKGVWSPTAKINASVTGAVAGFVGCLLLIYNFWLLDQVKKEHRRHFPQDAELVDPMKQNKFHQKVGRFLPNQKGY